MTCRLVGGRAWIVATAGELSLSTAGALELAVDERIQDGCCELVLDFTRVRSLRPSATIVLQQLQTRLLDAGCEVVVAAARPEVAAALVSGSLGDTWPVAPTAEDALAAMLARPVA